MMENLRQLCIYKHSYGEWDRKKWWDYVAYLHENCRGQANELCSMDAHNAVKIDYSTTKSCVEGSFNKDDYNDYGIVNNLIEQERSYHNKYGTSLFPAIVINNQTYRGEFDNESVFNALCAGFAQYPKVCHLLMESGDLKRADLENTDLYLKEIKHEDLVSKASVVSIFCLISIIFVCVLYFCRRQAKREMKD